MRTFELSKTVVIGCWRQWVPQRWRHHRQARGKQPWRGKTDENVSAAVPTRASVRRHTRAAGVA